MAENGVARHAGGIDADFCYAFLMVTGESTLVLLSVKFCISLDFLYRGRRRLDY